MTTVQWGATFAFRARVLCEVAIDIGDLLF